MPRRIPAPRRLFAAAALAASVSAVASADTVQLPYTVPDANGSQWMVFFNGNLQQQGNQPVFGQAGTITVNGQMGQRNSQTASYDDKIKEITVSFASRNVGFSQSRRIQFQDNGPARIIDVFDNGQDHEQTLNVSLMSNTNFGVNDTQILGDPHKKDVQIAWLANTGADRTALSVFGVRGTKNPPNMRYQPTNNNVVAQFQLKLPAKGRAALVHWHGTFDNADAATQWFEQQAMSGKALADVPADLRKAIVNVPTAGGAIGGIDLLRGTATADVIELRGGDLLRGTLQPSNYTLQTGYGEVTVAAGKVAGLATVGDDRPRQLLVTADGEVFAGHLKDATIGLALASGQTTQVPLTQINRVGYRLATGEPPELKSDRPMAFLASGERVLIAAPADPVELVTRYGTLKLTPEQIATVLLSPAAPVQTVYLSDGSRLSGVLTQSGWTLKLPSTTAADQAVTFPLATLARLQFKALPEGTGAGLPTLGLLGDDLVSAALAQPLQIVTAFDTLTIPGEQVAAIVRPQPGQADVQVTTFDQSTFRGTLGAPTLTVTLAAGPQLTFPAAALRDYQNPRPLPATAVTDRAKAAIEKLNGDDWKARETAEQDLTGIGPSIVPLLEATIPGQPPEAAERMTAILKKLKKDQPVPPSRLSPPPAVE